MKKDHIKFLRVHFTHTIPFNPFLIAQTMYLGPGIIVKRQCYREKEEENEEREEIKIGKETRRRGQWREANRLVWVNRSNHMFACKSLCNRMGLARNRKQPPLSRIYTEEQIDRGDVSLWKATFILRIDRERCGQKPRTKRDACCPVSLAALAFGLINEEGRWKLVLEQALQRYTCPTCLYRRPVE